MLPHKPSTLVLMGGPDAEREVSILSGTQVAAALRESGRFRVTDKVIDHPTIFELKALASECAADAIFPVLHGTWGEGGPLQELLEQLGLPYVGSQPRAAALAMDKMQTKAIVAREGVLTPLAQVLDADSTCTLKPPVVIKPVDDGSSVDLRICHSEADIDAARKLLHPKRGRLMAEAYIHGRELTVGIVLDQPLPLIEIIPAVQFYDYQAKYTREDTRYVIGPNLPTGVAERCVHKAMAAYRKLGCRDVARVDIMFDGVKPWFLEINTMPGFTTHSLVPMAARKRGGGGGAIGGGAGGGWPMPELCARLAQAALDRAHGGSQARSAALRVAR